MKKLLSLLFIAILFANCTKEDKVVGLITDKAIEDLLKFDSEFEKDFLLFFEDLRIFSNQKLKEISQTHI